MKRNACISVLLFVCVWNVGIRAQASSEVNSENKHSQRRHKTAPSRKKPHASARAGKGHPAKRTKSSAYSRKKAKKGASSALARQRAHRLKRAFVASADLKPMARQLLEDRSRPAYAGVEAYARRHAGTDAGALAWLVVGYAHILDKDYAKAIDPLKRAEPRAGDLGDYVAYFLASAYNAQSMSDNVIATLRTFETKYPDSLFLRNAMLVYGSALLTANRPMEAVGVMEKYRLPARPDYELAIGRAYLKTGSTARAAEAFKRAYYAFPTAAQAGDAKVELDKLVITGLAEPASFAERKARADLLAQAHRNADAAREYRALLNDVLPAQRDSLTVALGVALHRSGNDHEARILLQSVPDSVEENPLRLLALAEIARSANDEAGLMSLMSQLRQTASSSEFFEQALLLCGNMYLLRQDYDKAIDFYRELAERFPLSRRAAYAHWKASWLSLRQGRIDEAKKDFEEHVARYPNSAEAPAAMYWRGRLAEDDQEPGKARAWYLKLTERFQNYYYSELARARLARLRSVAVVNDPILDRLPPFTRPAGFEHQELPADNVRVQKSLLLENGGMTDFAVKELRAAAADGGAGWASLQMARVYQDNGRYDRALRTLKRAVPGYYALEVNQLPRPYWETLFPRPFWSDLQKFARQNELDPFLVASLVRQESEFNPGAVSRADALGLMQLLPTTGRKVARELRVRRFSASALLTPNVNLELGTRYFRTMVNQFNGKVEYALAAYNAGPDRVQSWLANGNYRDTEEFVESIPFTETREYVQAIMRNMAMYKRLYATSGPSR